MALEFIFSHILDIAIIIGCLYGVFKLWDWVSKQNLKIFNSHIPNDTNKIYCPECGSDIGDFIDRSKNESKRIRKEQR